MKFTRLEFIPDKNGGHWKETEYEREFPETADRPDKICVMCGWPLYPECKKTCHNFREGVKYHDPVDE